jgi:hypothetical protein
VPRVDGSYWLPRESHLIAGMRVQFPFQERRMAGGSATALTPVGRLANFTLQIKLFLEVC